MRPLRFQPGYLPHAEGSCLVTMGNTKVLCVATVEDKVPPHAEEKGIGWVTAEYAMLPRAGESRSSRSRVNSGGRVQEISRLVGRSLRMAVSLPDLGPRTITVDCDVIRADGGTRTAAVNGGFVSLALALKKISKQGALAKWPLKDFVGAISVGMVKGKPVVDMCYSDDKDAETDLNVVMTGRGQLVEIQGTAEGKPFSEKELAQMMRLARRGIRAVTRAQKRAVGKLPQN